MRALTKEQVEKLDRMLDEARHVTEEDRSFLGDAQGGRFRANGKEIPKEGIIQWMSDELDAPNSAITFLLEQENQMLGTTVRLGMLNNNPAFSEYVADADCKLTTDENPQTTDFTFQNGKIIKTRVYTLILDRSECDNLADTDVRQLSLCGIIEQQELRADGFHVTSLYHNGTQLVEDLITKPGTATATKANAPQLLQQLINELKELNELKEKLIGHLEKYIQSRGEMTANKFSPSLFTSIFRNEKLTNEKVTQANKLIASLKTMNSVQDIAGIFRDIRKNERIQKSGKGSVSDFALCLGDCIADIMRLLPSGSASVLSNTSADAGSTAAAAVPPPIPRSGGTTPR